MRILIIEDDRQTAEFIAGGLQDAGFRTCCASDGLDGLLKAKSESFDLAVVDIMLPKLDGLSVIDGIRAAKNNMPVIVLSAKDSVKSADWKEAGMIIWRNRFLSRSFLPGFKRCCVGLPLLRNRPYLQSEIWKWTCCAGP